jgi:hypothetical protein
MPMRKDLFYVSGFRNSECPRAKRGKPEAWGLPSDLHGRVATLNWWRRFPRPPMDPVQGPMGGQGLEQGSLPRSRAVRPYESILAFRESRPCPARTCQTASRCVVRSVHFAFVVPPCSWSASQLVPRRHIGKDRQTTSKYFTGSSS